MNWEQLWILAVNKSRLLKEKLQKGQDVAERHYSTLGSMVRVPSAIDREVVVSELGALV